MKRILVVDDEANMRSILKLLLENDGYAVLTASDGREAIGLLEGRQDVDLIVSDLRMPENDGMELLAYLRQAERFTPVIIVTAFGSIEGAVEAMKAGAVDFITKPFDKDVLRQVVRRNLQAESLAGENEQPQAAITGGDFVYCSEVMGRIVDTLRKVGTTLTPLLLTGESGTGKGAAAKLVHAFRDDTKSPGDHKPFVHINCPAIPDSLFESELFGYQKGAFTGASQDFGGKVRLADGGTLFLDEVAEVPLQLQSKLLQLLESRTYQPIGSTSTVRIEAKIICATNRDLDRLMKDGLFREDLYFRINTICVKLPPLRDRREDVSPLSEFFLSSLSREMARKNAVLTDAVRQALMRYAWPGNVRELHNVIERALVLSETGRITLADLPPELTTLDHQALLPGGNMDNRIDKTERDLLAEALQESDWNISAAAKALGVSRSRLRYRIEKYGLHPG